MKQEHEVIKSISYIQDGSVFFQVLNNEQTDWDEDATRVAYEAWKELPN